MRRWHIAAWVLVWLLAASPSAMAGKGHFESDKGLVLHVYFPTAQSDWALTNTWEPRLRDFSNRWYDACERRSYIKTLYLYNGSASGKSGFDLYISNRLPDGTLGSGAYSRGSLGGLWDYMYVSMGFGDSWFPVVLVHELGHHALSLKDEYGGVLREVGGNEIPWPRVDTSPNGPGGYRG